MIALCVAAWAATAEAVIATDRFTLVWRHSVEKTEWREDYVIQPDRRLRLEAAWIEGSGAGMDPPEGAVKDGAFWRYRPDLPPLSQLVLTRSRHTADYRLCWQDQCSPLDRIAPIAGDGARTRLFGCERPR